MKDLKTNEQITPNKPQTINQRFDSETYESSKKDINNSDISNEKIPKKSIDFFPKKMNIEKLDKSLEIYRKYSLENKLIIKDFVPKLRPIEIHVMPSKFRLNRKGFKDLKRNKKNKILLNSNNYYISCPNSEEDSDESQNFESSKEIFPLKSEQNNSHNKLSLSVDKKIIDIKLTRKFLQKTKNKNIPKIYSKNNFTIKGKYSKDLDLGNSSSDSDLYDINEIDDYDDYSSLTYENKEIKEGNTNKKEKNNKNRNRTRSLSILEMLQKKYLNED